MLKGMLRQAQAGLGRLGKAWAGLGRLGQCLLGFVLGWAGSRGYDQDILREPTWVDMCNMHSQLQPFKIRAPSPGGLHDQHRGAC